MIRIYRENIMTFHIYAQLCTFLLVLLPQTVVHLGVAKNGIQCLYSMSLVKIWFMEPNSPPWQKGLMISARIA